MTIEEVIKHEQEQVGPRIEQLRNIRGWTKKQLSQASGISVSVINNIIKNPDYNGRITNILKITDALELKPHEIYLPDREWKEFVKEYPDHIKLQDILSKLSDEEKKAFLDYGKTLLEKKK